MLAPPLVTLVWISIHCSLVKAGVPMISSNGLPSTLAVEATRIFAKNTDYCDEEVTDYIKKYGTLPQMPQLRLCESAADSKALNSEEGSRIILSASGMADTGRVLHHLIHNLWRPESTVLFVGYQAEGSLGRRLIEGAKQVKLWAKKSALRPEL